MQSDALYVRGHVKIVAKYLDGTTKILFDRSNMVVNNGLVVTTELWSQDVSAETALYNKFGSIWLGGRATGSGSTAGATAPDATQTGLQGTLITQLPISTVNYLTPLPYGADYVSTLDFTVGNNMDIQEVALFTRGTNDDPVVAAGASPAPRMFARQVVGTISKTNALSLQFTWRMTISGS